MSLDEKVEEAVHKAVSDLEQGEQVGGLFLSWLERLSKEDLSVTENNDCLRSVLETLEIDEAENSSGS